MLSIIYVSKVKNMLGQHELTALADEAARSNNENQITGLLVYNGEHFMQLIEGESSRIENLLKRIERDDRHSDLVVIRRREDQPRECPAWSMRCYTVPLKGVGAADEIFQSVPANFQADTRVIFTSFASLVREAA